MKTPKHIRSAPSGLPRRSTAKASRPHRLPSQTEATIAGQTELTAHHSLLRKLDQATSIILMLAVGVTPLIFTSLSSELFEFPKMVWTYALAVFGLLLIFYRTILLQHIDIPRTPLERPFLAYLLIFLLATAGSVDLYTSIAGYYTRFHGGLASLAAYLILAFLALIYLHNPAHRYLRIWRLLYAWLTGATLVSAWAIAQHTGYDPGCWLIGRTWSAECWVQDAQARAFASFGQPNWLATYLVASLPIALAAMLSQPHRLARYGLVAVAALMYAAFWYTFSRSGWLGLIAAAIVLICCLPISRLRPRWLELAVLLLICLIISASSATMAVTRTATSLDAGQEDSSTGQIRLLVWHGSVNLIKQHPWLGTGPETFAYTFLPHRPAGMNMTTEWNFLYNKAHNEVLQTAATTGFIGLSAWLGLHLGLIFYLWRQGWLYNLNAIMQRMRLKLTRASWQIDPVRPLTADQQTFLPITAALTAGIIGVFVAQLLGFSVVVTGLFFWLSLAILVTPSTTIQSVKLPSGTKLILVAGLCFIFIGGLGYGLIRYTSAELLRTQADSSPSVVTAMRLHQQAAKLNPFEPNYWLQASTSQAKVATLLTKDEGRELIGQAVASAQRAESLNPSNQIVIKGLVSTYQQLAVIDDQFHQEAIRLAKEAVRLAPNDAAAIQTLAGLQAAAGQLAEAEATYNQLVGLRPEADSYVSRAQFWLQSDRQDQAVADLKQALQLNPDHAKAQELLQSMN